MRKKATAKSYTSTQDLTQSENSDDERDTWNEQPNEVLRSDRGDVAEDDHSHDADRPKNRFFQGSYLAPVDFGRSNRYCKILFYHIHRIRVSQLGG